MFSTRLSHSGKTAIIVDDTGAPAVVKIDGKPLSMAPAVAQARAERMNADAQREEALESADDKAYRAAAAQLTQIIDEADSRCQAQPIHRSRGVRAEGRVQINGRQVKACGQCVAHYGKAA